MKVSEAALWTWLSQARRSGHHLCRVENTLGSAMPDVEASTGRGGFWIELKTCAKPKRDRTSVPVRFRPGQAAWLKRRWDVDSGAWLLCQVDRERFLIPGSLAPVVETGLTYRELVGVSIKILAPMTPEKVLEAASNFLGK